MNYNTVIDLFVIDTSELIMNTETTTQEQISRLLEHLDALMYEVRHCSGAVDYGERATEDVWFEIGRLQEKITKLRNENKK